MYNSAMVRDTILAARQTRTRKVQTAQHVASAVESFTNLAWQSLSELTLYRTHIKRR